MVRINRHPPGEDNTTSTSNRRFATPPFAIMPSYVRAERFARVFTPPRRAAAPDVYACFARRLPSLRRRLSPLLSARHFLLSLKLPERGGVQMAVWQRCRCGAQKRAVWCVLRMLAWRRYRRQAGAVRGVRAYGAAQTAGKRGSKVLGAGGRCASQCWQHEPTEWCLRARMKRYHKRTMRGAAQVRTRPTVNCPTSNVAELHCPHPGGSKPRWWHRQVVW